MNVDEAIALATLSFPKGPEAVAIRLGVDIRYSMLDGCDGWCLAAIGSPAIIRIKDRRSPTSQRFTLAHELGHLLLGIPPTIGETFANMLASESEAEKRVNRLAAELLMPLDIVRRYIKDPPIVARSLERLARISNVSVVAAALRVTNSANQLGLQNAAVIRFEQDKLKWMWSPTLEASSETIYQILCDTRQSHPIPHRRVQNDGRMVVSSLIDNPHFNSTTIFVQLLTPEAGSRPSTEERRRHLEVLLFTGDTSLRNRVQGCFGAFKSKVVGTTLPEAVSLFWETYQLRFALTPLNSAEGREYVEIRLGEWCN